MWNVHFSGATFEGIKSKLEALNKLKRIVLLHNSNEPFLARMTQVENGEVILEYYVNVLSWEMKLVKR